MGIMFGLLALAAFRIGIKGTGELAGGQTLAFMVLALSQILQAFNMKSGHSLFRTGAFGNKALNRATLISVLSVVLVLFTPLSTLFGLVVLPAALYGVGLFLICIPVIVMEIAKSFTNEL